MTKQYAVLTGDIIKSHKLTPSRLKAVRKRLEQSAAELNQWKKGLIIGKMDFFRGDGWQLAISEPKLALRVCLYLRAGLIAFEKADTRIAVGIGTVEHLDKQKISRSTGPAFEQSGMALDKLKKHRYMTISIFDEQSKATQWLNVVFSLCDGLSQRFSPRQAEAVMGALLGFTQEKIAQNTVPPVDQTAIARYLSQACWHAIDDALDNTEL